MNHQLHYHLGMSWSQCGFCRWDQVRDVSQELIALVQCELLPHSAHRSWEPGKGPGENVKAWNKVSQWLFGHRFRTFK